MTSWPSKRTRNQSLEFQKYLAFALGNHVLRTDDERHLIAFGGELGLKEDEMVALIETELKDSGAKRIDPDEIGKTQESNGAAKPSLNKNDDFMRMLRLSGLDSDAMTDDQRDAFINMAENLGIEPGDAEDMVDVYLEEVEEKALANACSSACSSQGHTGRGGRGADCRTFRCGTEISNRRQSGTRAFFQFRQFHRRPHGFYSEHRVCDGE